VNVGRSNGCDNLPGGRDSVRKDGASNGGEGGSGNMDTHDFVGWRRLNEGAVEQEKRGMQLCMLGSDEGTGLKIDE